MNRARDEELLAALDMLRSGAAIHAIAIHFATDDRNLGAALRKIKSADAECGEDLGNHYGRLK